MRKVLRSHGSWKRSLGNEKWDNWIWKVDNIFHIRCRQNSSHWGNFFWCKFDRKWRKLISIRNTKRVYVEIDERGLKKWDLTMHRLTKRKKSSLRKIRLDCKIVNWLVGILLIEFQIESRLEIDSYVDEEVRAFFFLYIRCSNPCSTRIQAKEVKKIEKSWLWNSHEAFRQSYKKVYCLQFPGGMGCHILMTIQK